MLEAAYHNFMKINDQIFDKAETYNAKVLVVTKYFDVLQTREALAEVQDQVTFWALGENRIDDIIKKQLPRGLIHFIGNIQSRRISDIAMHCSAVHSLSQPDHAEKFEKALAAAGLKLDVFLQVNISGEDQKLGCVPKDLPDLIKRTQQCPHINIVGVSSMGVGEFTYESKKQEFQQLIALRDTHLPGKLISAGTSRDYEIALAQGIEVVRIGQHLFP